MGNNLTTNQPGKTTRPKSSFSSGIKQESRPSMSDDTGVKIKSSPSHSSKSRLSLNLEKSVKNRESRTFVVGETDRNAQDPHAKRNSFGSTNSKTISNWEQSAESKKSQLLVSSSSQSGDSPKMNFPPQISPNHRPRISFNNREVAALRQSPSIKSSRLSPSPHREMSPASKKILSSIHGSLDPSRKSFPPSRSSPARAQASPKKSLSASQTSIRKSSMGQSEEISSFGAQKSHSSSKFPEKVGFKSAASKIIFDESDSISDHSTVSELFEETVIGTKRSPVIAAKVTSSSSKVSITSAIKSNSPRHSPEKVPAKRTLGRESPEKNYSRKVLGKESPRKRSASSPSKSPHQKRSKTVSFHNNSIIIANDIEYSHESILDPSISSLDSWEEFIDHVDGVSEVDGITTVFTKWKNGSTVYISIEKAKKKFPVKIVDYFQSKIFYFPSNLSLNDDGH